MNLIQMIKRPRDMSLSNWRYRLLHWTFCQKNITHPSQSRLPSYLYSHFCPLFHLTNLLVLAFVPIAIVRGLYWAGSMVFFNVIDPCLGFLLDLLVMTISLFQKKKKKKEPVFRKKTDEDYKIEEANKCVSEVVVFFKEYRHENSSREEEFDRFVLLSETYEFISKPEMKIIFDDVMFKLEAKERASKRFYARIDWMINWSQKIFKGGLEIAKYSIAVTALVAICAVAYMYGSVAVLGIQDFLNGIYNNGWFILQIIVIGAGVVSFIMAIFFAAERGHLNWLAKIGKINIFPDWAKSYVAYLGIPFVYLFGALGWVAIQTCSWIAMFYKDNCPMITIKEFELSND